MLGTWSHFINEINAIGALSVLKSALVILFGILFAKIGSQTSAKVIKRYATSQQAMLFEKVIYFVILILFIVTALQQLGFKLSVLLGSAGIITAAIAIASQTSIANIVSGVFLILEKSFQIGDKIKIGETTGKIISIDLLSMKILSSHNTLIRVPNETMIKAEITNFTRFDTRKLELPITVAYKENIKQVKTILLKVMEDNPLVLKEPTPEVSVENFSESGIVLQLSVWTEQKNFDALKDKLLEEIKVTFDQHKIEMPYPQKMVHLFDFEEMRLKDIKKSNQQKSPSES